MSQFKIDKDIPPPSNGRSANRKYPFGEMEIGDSFFVEDQAKLLSLRFCAAQFGRRNNKKFSVHKQPDGGARVWRIA